MVKTLNTSHCFECTSFGTNKKGEPACKRMNVVRGWGRVLTNRNLKIPSWCPIPDKELSDTEEEAVKLAIDIVIKQNMEAFRELEGL